MILVRILSYGPFLTSLVIFLFAFKLVGEPFLLEKEGVPGTGKIVERISGESGSFLFRLITSQKSSYKLKIKYENNGAEHMHTLAVTENGFQSSAVGDIVDVVYSPGKPRRVLIPGKSIEVGAVQGLWAPVLMIIVSIIAIRITGRAARKSR